MFDADSVSFIEQPYFLNHIEHLKKEPHSMAHFLMFVMGKMDLPMNPNQQLWWVIS